MKKGLFLSYFDGITNYENGQQYKTLLQYFIPEFITAVVLYSIPLLIDARWIACLSSTSAYATLGVTNTMLHFISKIAEGLSVSAIVMTGFFNGQKKFKEAGSTFSTLFWTSVIVGAIVSIFLYVCAHWIYSAYQIPEEMIAIGVPFLKIRAIGVFFTFIYFSLVGFLRGTKNTKSSMYIFISGSIIFVLFDYLLIFGKFGFPALNLIGSAMASVIQYVSMSIIALFYILYSNNMSVYEASLSFKDFSLTKVRAMFAISMPVVVDKASLSWSYIWMGRCLAPMGTVTLASFSVIKEIERLAFLPGIAFAQVITFLSSNDYGNGKWNEIKINVKKVLFLSTLMVIVIVLFCALNIQAIIHFFDFKGEFTNFASRVFPMISVLIFLDLFQLILAAALRGAMNVKIVMWTRLGVCIFFFTPVSYYFSNISTTDIVLKFVLIYSSLYVGNGIMSLIYIKWFRLAQWQKNSI